jgi:hypothetical protein
MLNAKFDLLNGTTSWKSMAKYTCKPGFKMVFENSECLLFLKLLVIFNSSYGVG